MCRKKSARHPEGVRCRDRRALTYTAMVLDQAVEKFAKAASEPATTEAPAAGQEPSLSPGWIQKLWAAALEVHKKVIRLKAKRAQARADREAEAQEAIEAAEVEAERQRLEQREARIKAAYKKLDDASDNLLVASMDHELLEDDAYPGPEERRTMLLKEAKAEATKAVRASQKLALAFAEADQPSSSLMKRLAAAEVKEAAAVQLVEHLEGSITRAPTRKDAAWRLGQARGAWAEAEQALIEAENS